MVTMPLSAAARPDALRIATSATLVLCVVSAGVLFAARLLVARVQRI